MKRRHVPARWGIALLVACGAVAAYVAIAGADPAVRIAKTPYPPTPRAVYAPSDLARETDGTTWIADTGNDRVLKLSAAGERLGEWTSDGSGTAFDRPTAIALSSTGKVYVVDTDNHRIVVIGPTGTVEGAFGSYGSGAGQLSFPTGVAVDSTGDIFVSDTGNDRIQRFSASGVHEASFGTVGSLPGQFTGPKGIAISGTQVYVADSGNKRVAVMTTAGNWVTSWGPYVSGEFTVSRYAAPSDVWVAGSSVFVADTGNNQVEVCTTSGGATARWGSSGTGDTQFKLPVGVWSDGISVWIADTGNNRLLQHSATGVYLNKWQAAGSGSAELDSPKGVARDAAGNSYVADTANNRVQKYDANGAHVQAIGVGDLLQPQGVAVDPAGDIFVADTGNNRIRRFSASGSVVGTVAASLNAPRGVAVDASGKVYVADTGNNAVRVYSSAGTPLYSWGSYGTGSLQFKSPSALAVTGATVYVSDTGNARVSQFTLGAGVTYVGSWGGLGTSEGAFRLPLGVAVASDGNVWVCDSANDRLQEFTPEGQFVSVFGATGGAPGEFHAPSGIAAGPGGLLIVAEASASRVQQLALDTASPVTTISGIPAGWSKDATITLTATDDIGVAETRYRIGAGPVQRYTAPFGGLPEGQSTLYYASEDLLGRQETTKSASVLIDRTAPTTTSNIGASWFRSPFSVVLSRTDALSGGVTTTYTLDGGAVRTYTGSVLVSGEGDHVVRYRSTDAAGNVAEEQSGTVRLDDTPPTTTSDASGLWRSTPETLTLGYSDGRSGVAAVTYRVGTGTPRPYAGPFQVSDEGQTEVAYWSTDYAGNVEPANTVVVRVDRTAPVSVINVGEPFADRTRRITLSATDSGSGGVVIRYSMNGEIPSTYFGPLTIDAQVPTRFDYWATDRLGNKEVTQTVLVEWDYAPPVTSSNLDGEWRSTPATVSLSATDTMSAVVDTSYRIDDGVTLDYGAPFVVSKEGVTKVGFWSTDAKDNTEAEKTGWVRIDRTPPVTAMSVGDPLPDETRLVSLAATDTGAGGTTTRYSVNGGPSALYEGAFPVSSTVAVSVSYWSVDRLGNTEATQTTLIDDDFVPPTTTTSDLDGVWRTTPVLVSLDATDAISGVYQTYYRIGSSAVTTYTGTPFSVSAEGQTAITYWSVDNAGLREADNTGWVRIDRTAPTSYVTAGAPYANRTRLVTVTTADGGVGGVTTRYSINSGEATTYAGPFLIDASVPVTVAVSSADALGNRETTQTVRFEYDYSTPVTTSNLDGVWRKTAASVTLSATDVGSGVRNTYYRLGDSVVQTYTGSAFTVNAEGQTRVTYWSVDNRSNVESDNVGWVRIDRTAPESTSTIMFDPYQSSAIVTLDATDTGGCGLAGIQYRLGTSSVWIDYVGGFFLGTAGDTVVHIRATDLLGNVEPEDSFTVTLRELVPATTSTIDDRWHNDNVTVRLTASYEGTAPVSTYYRLGDGETAGYSSPFVVSAEGETRVTYWSVAKGVAEPDRVAFVRIDKTPPTTEYTQEVLSGPTRVTVTLEATDSAGSGIEGTYYRVGNGATWTRYTQPFAVEGGSIVWYRSIDNAGNEELARFKTIPPVTSTNVVSTRWYRYSVLMSLNATHPAGAPIVTYYRFAGQAVGTRYATPFAITREGVTPVQYWSVSDGVSEFRNRVDVRIDKSRPTISYLASPTHPRSTTYYRARNVRFTWRGYDRYSGVGAYAYTMTRSATTVPSTARTTTATSAYYRDRASGTWYFHIRARDKAGNWGPTRHIRVRIR